MVKSPLDALTPPVLSENTLLHCVAVYNDASYGSTIIGPSTANLAGIFISHVHSQEILEKLSLGGSGRGGPPTGCCLYFGVAGGSWASHIPYLSAGGAAAGHAAATLSFMGLGCYMDMFQDLHASEERREIENAVIGAVPSFVATACPLHVSTAALLWVGDREDK